VGGSRRRRSLIWLIMPEKYSGETSLGRRNPDLFDEYGAKITAKTAC
jgi:hypothetical protein